MEYFNEDSLLYLGLIVLFLVYFLWSKNRSGKKRDHLRKRSFRHRYEERKKERKTEEAEDQR